METRIDELFYKKLGHELNEQRQKLGYSFKYLSKLTGISYTQLDDYLNGKYRIKKDVYNIICKALQINPQITLDLKIGG